MTINTMEHQIHMPWTGMAQSLEAWTAAEALKEANLDWEVEKQTIKFGENNKIFKGRHAVVRMTDQKELVHRGRWLQALSEC